MVHRPETGPGLHGTIGFPLLVLAALGLISSNATADLLDDARTVRPQLGAKYDAAYAHVEIRTVEKSTAVGNEHHNNWTQTCQYLRNGDLVRATGTLVESDLPGMRLVGVLAACRDYHFQASQSRGNPNFVLQDFSPVKAGDDFLAERSSCRPVFASSHMDGIKVDDILTGKIAHPRPVSADEITLDGKRVIRVIAQFDPQQSGGQPIQWQLYFLPEQWAFAGASQPLGRTVIETRIAYEGDDPLRLQSIKRWVSSTDAPQVRHDQVDTRVTSIAFRTVPEGEFRLAALGLEEPAVARTSRTRSVFVWISATVFGVLGILFAVMSVLRRRRSLAAAGARGAAGRG